VAELPLRVFLITHSLRVSDPFRDWRSCGRRGILVACACFGRSCCHSCRLLSQDVVLIAMESYRVDQIGVNEYQAAWIFFVWLYFVSFSGSLSFAKEGDDPRNHTNKHELIQPTNAI